MSDQEQAKKRLIIDFKDVFGTKAGERVLNRLSDLCHENVACYVDQNPYAMAYHEGKRCVILHIRKMLEKDSRKERQETAKDVK